MHIQIQRNTKKPTKKRSSPARTTTRSPKRIKERIELMNDDAGKEAVARSLRLRWRLVSRHNNSKSMVQFFKICEWDDFVCYGGEWDASSSLFALHSRLCLQWWWDMRLHLHLRLLRLVVWDDWWSGEMICGWVRWVMVSLGMTCD